MQVCLYADTSKTTQWNPIFNFCFQQSFQKYSFYEFGFRFYEFKKIKV